MAKGNSTQKSAPSVRIVPRPSGVFQVRYRGDDGQVRLSAGTRDRSKAEDFRDEVEAKLRLGIDPRESPEKQKRMTWKAFREKYSTLGLVNHRRPQDEESSLDVVERAIKPRYIDQFSSNDYLRKLAVRLRNGDGHAPNRKRKPRRPAAVASILRSLKAALNTGHELEWIDFRCTYRIQTVDADEPRGRPLNEIEVETFMEAIKGVCKYDVDGWTMVVNGLITTGLRLDELFSMSWDQPGTIRPKQTKSGNVVLEIPGSRQKNKKTETIPTIPAFALLLAKIPVEKREGRVFQPVNRFGKVSSPKQAGRVLSDVGKAAGIVINDEGKHASAHDLRRTFGGRLAAAGVPAADLKKIMRHSSVTTTMKYYVNSDAEEAAQRIAERLQGTVMGTPGINAQKEIDVSR